MLGFCVGITVVVVTAGLLPFGSDEVGVTVAVTSVTILGECVGIPVGSLVRSELVLIGCLEGLIDGASERTPVGFMLGLRVGKSERVAVGFLVGRLPGVAVG